MNELLKKPFSSLLIIMTMIIIKYFRIVIKMFVILSNIKFFPVYNFSQSVMVEHIIYKKEKIYSMVSMMCISYFHVSNVFKNMLLETRLWLKIYYV